MGVSVGTGAAAAAGLTSFPTLPAPLKDEGFIVSVGKVIPHKGTLIDNIQLPTTFGNGAADGAIVGLLGDTTVWTVDSADLDGTADGFLSLASALWYDDINDRLYMFGINIGATPDAIHTGYITLETGATTDIGDTSGITGDVDDHTAISSWAVSRTSIDSGDFTLKHADRTLVIDESNGSLVSDTTESNISSRANTNIGSYTTLDGTVICKGITQVSSGGAGYVIIARGGQQAFVPIPASDTITNSTASVATPLNWGDKVKFRSPTTGNSSAILRTFDRVEFDAWLQLVADYGGLA